MIKIENVVTPSPEQWKSIIMGMRNPLNSYNRSDSQFWPEHMQLGENDKDLMKRLADGGPVHAKYRRMITVYAEITAPRYFWAEMSTYKVGTVFNSCSTMHTIHKKEFELDDFSHEHMSDDVLLELNRTIEVLNIRRKDFLETKEKTFWWDMIQLLPQSYNQKRTVMMNYEVLCNIYHSRKDHKLDEWHDFCDWIKTLPYSKLITGERNVSECEN